MQEHFYMGHCAQKEKEMSFGVKFLACVLTFYLVTALYAFMYILKTKDAVKLDKGHEYQVVENNLKEPKLQLGKSII